MKLGEKKGLREEQSGVEVRLAQLLCGTPHETRGCLRGWSKWFKVKGGALATVRTLSAHKCSAGCPYFILNKGMKSIAECFVQILQSKYV